MSKRRLAIDVEPLSERRWAAIEERVLRRAPPGSEQHVREISPRRLRPGPVAAAIAIAAALAAVVALAWWPRDAPVERVLASSRVVTAADVAQTVAGDVAIEVAPRSSVHVLQRDRDAWLVSIEHGSARFRVPARAGRPAFVVEAGLTRVEVVGTTFTVSRRPGDASASVVVDEGTVRVTEGGAEALVHAGERWPVEPEHEHDAIEREHDAIEAPTVRSRPAPLGPEASSDATPPARENTSARVRLASGAHPDRASRRTATEIETETESAVESAGATRVLEAPTARERFARAEALERTASETALREYAALAREGGAWGANALFAQGRLELELGHLESARALLERYLARHPTGLNAEDARGLLDRLR